MGRPTQHNHPLGQSGPGKGQNDTRPLCDTRIPHPPAQARRRARHAWRRPQRQGHARTSFPNPEAKTASADGTAPARVWESRTPPPAHHKRGGPPRAPPFRTHTHRPHGQATVKTTAPATPPHTPQKPRTRQSSPHRTGHTATHTGHTHKHRPSAHRPHSRTCKHRAPAHTDRPHSHTRKHRAPAHRPKFATPRLILEHRVRASPSRARSRRTQPNTRTQVDAVGYETCV